MARKRKQFNPLAVAAMVLVIVVGAPIGMKLIAAAVNEVAVPQMEP